MFSPIFVQIVAEINGKQVTAVEVEAIPPARAEVPLRYESNETNVSLGTVVIVTLSIHWLGFIYLPFDCDFCQPIISLGVHISFL